MKKSLLGLGVILALSGCASDVYDPLEEWVDFVPGKISTTRVGENQALAVFYREGDIQGPAVNVYVDGNYQASLLPNAFTSVTVCANNHAFAAAFSSNIYFPERSKGGNYNLAPNEVAYIKISQNPNGQVDFTRVDSVLGSEIVARLPQENQTLSRTPVAANCGLGVGNVFASNAFISAEKVTVETLGGALFAFNGSAYKDIQAEGKMQIQVLAEKVKAMLVDRIEVAGHTDPSGSDKYNQVLSQKRAETVKKALQKAGVTVPITAVGYGESKPVVNCEDQKGQAQKACNMPNRRVEISVYEK